MFHLNIGNLNLISMDESTLYEPVSSPSFLYDEKMEKLLRRNENIKIVLVSMPMNISVDELPTSVKLDSNGKLVSAESSTVYLKQSSDDLSNVFKRTHAIWRISQGETEAAPGKPVSISRHYRPFDEMWEIRLK